MISILTRLHRIAASAITAILLLTPVLSIAPLANAADVYDARIAGPEILTPPPPSAPRINGPNLYGARPDKPFLYRIPTTGNRPIHFEAQGLPPSLSLDPQHGILTGRAPAKKGEFPITFKARNAHGQTSKTFTLVVGDTLALTPPMGWNHWYTHYHLITDPKIRAAADAMVASGMADAGYQYISIDDCWMRITAENAREVMDPNRRWGATARLDLDAKCGPVRDADGTVLPARDFPDMNALTDHIHAYGLKAGIYTSPGQLTCQKFEGSYGHELLDAQTYAAWGFDLLKYDWCSYTRVWNLMKGNKQENRSIPYRLMGGILEQQNRDILLNICEYGHDVWLWGAEVGGHSWRIGGDLGHALTEGGVYKIAQKNIQIRQYNRPGAWNDPDYLILGRWTPPSDKAGPLAPVSLSPNEQYSYFSLWCMMACPLFFSGDIAALDDFTTNILCNTDLIAVNQDPLGQCAAPIRLEENGDWILKKNLADGSLVVAFFDTANQSDREIAVTWQDLGIQGPHALRDLWRQKDIGQADDELSVRVSPLGCAVIHLEPTNATGRHEP